MARNYRKVDGGITAWGLVCRLVLFLLFVAFGLSIVMQETRMQKIGKDIKDAEEKVALLRNQNMILQARLSDLKTPRALIQKAEEWQLNLRPVSDLQVVKCKEPSAKATLAYARSMIAQDERQRPTGHIRVPQFRR
jgi:cell division protein FtsL